VHLAAAAGLLDRALLAAQLAAPLPPLNELIAGAFILVCAGGSALLLRYGLRAAAARGVGVAAALAPALSSLVLAAAMVVSAVGAASGALSLAREARGVLLLTYAVCQLHLTTKTIVFGMAHQPFPTFQLTALGLPLLVCLDAYDAPLAQAAAPLVCVLALAGYASLVVSFVSSISATLGINIFTITPREHQKTQRIAAAAAAQPSKRKMR
jgi:hypothetical protein